MPEQPPHPSFRLPAPLRSRRTDTPVYLRRSLVRHKDGENRRFNGPHAVRSHVEQYNSGKASYPRSPPSEDDQAFHLFAVSRSAFTGCGKTRPRRGSGDFTSPHALCFQQQHGDVKSPLHVFPQPVKLLESLLDLRNTGCHTCKIDRSRSQERGHAEEG